ncbi:hypothetical protein D3C75_995090 [compost metagenome]
MADGGSKAVKVGKVAAQASGALTIEGNHFTQRGKGALQLPAYLAIFAQQQDFHALFAPYCCATQSR